MQPVLKFLRKMQQTTAHCTWVNIWIFAYLKIVFKSESWLKMQSESKLWVGCGCMCEKVSVFSNSLNIQIDKENVLLWHLLEGSRLGINNSSSSRLRSIMWMLVVLLKYLIFPWPSLHTVLPSSYFSLPLQNPKYVRLDWRKIQKDSIDSARK